MKRETVIYIPYWIKRSKTNEYITNTIQILQEKYQVNGDLAEPFEISKMLHTKAVFLNWIEQDLDTKMKIQISLHKLLGAQIIWVFHNKYPHDVKQDEHICKNINWIANHSSRIVLHSKNSVQFIPNLNKNRNKAVYIPHLLYKSHNENVDLNEVRAKYGICQKDFVFLIFGRIRPYKNIEEGIEVFRALKLHDAKLIIAGKPEDNKYADKLKRLCRDDSDIILDLQFISNMMLDNLIDISDVVVLPYKDGSSMNSGVMIQAFSRRTTVITPDICMARDMAEEKFFYMYKNSLEKVMMKAYKNGKDTNKFMGMCAGKYLNKNNNWEEVKKKIYDLLGD